MVRVGLLVGQSRDRRRARETRRSLSTAPPTLRSAAKRITDSKSFDNSILCTNESVLIAERWPGAELKRELQRDGCHICSAEEVEAMRAYLFHERRLQRRGGRPRCGVDCRAGRLQSAAAKTRVLVTPFEFIGARGAARRTRSFVPCSAMFVALPRGSRLSKRRARCCGSPAPGIPPRSTASIRRPSSISRREWRPTGWSSTRPAARARPASTPTSRRAP